MRALELKIEREGSVREGGVLKVGGFLNHRIDVDFLMEMGEELAFCFGGCNVNKIITVEASGIALAVAAAAPLHVPVVFAKKHKTLNLPENVYSSSVYSFTSQKEYPIIVDKSVLSSDDRLLIIDDFLAHGNAIRGLMDIAAQAGASVVGAGIAIEKGFQHGGDKLREEGLKIESLAVIESMENGKIVFRR